MQVVQGTYRTNKAGSKVPRLPEAESRIKDGTVRRFNSNHEWKDRRLVLTDQDVLLTLHGHDQVIEKIPLVNI